MDYRRIKAVEKKLNEIEEKIKAEDGNHFRVIDSNGDPVKVKFDDSPRIKFIELSPDGTGLHFV